MILSAFAGAFGLGANNRVIGIRSETVISPTLANWLDLARGLAAVEVLVFHAYQLMFQEQVPGAGYDASIVFAYSAVRALSAHGVAAVTVFFVLSGYLVGGPALIRAKKWWAKRYRLFFSKSSATLRRAHTCACDFLLCLCFSKADGRVAGV